MPILIWIATVACMLEMAGMLPASAAKRDIAQPDADGPGWQPDADGPG
jgi:hypothetical protein